MAYSMNPVTKRAYKAEFEITNISLQELMDKYQITEEELGRTDNWEKRTTKDIEVIPIKPAHSNKNQDIIVIDNDKTMLEEIQDTKKLVLKNVQDYFGPDGDADMASTKEIKDMVGVLKDLETGELMREGKGDKGPTINILVQNLAERFKDDC